MTHSSLVGRHRDLAHIPGNLGLPLIGSTIRALRDPVGLARERLASYGSVYKARSIYMTSISLLGPDAAQYVLQDKDQIFSSMEGWRPNLGRLFPNSLMLQDFGVHKGHRQIMLEAFKRPAVERYTEIMEHQFSDRIAEWADNTQFDVYPEIKRLLLELGIHLFLGEDLTDEPWIGPAMVAMTSASTSLVRAPLPGSMLKRGIAARRKLASLIRRLIAQARESQSGTVLNRLCTAQDVDGKHFEDDQIVDHMLFIIMAAHDTTTSATTTLMLELADHPEWQERIRSEIRQQARSTRDGYETIDWLQRLRILDSVYKECLRLYPPVPAIPRFTLREGKFSGVRLPAGRHVWLFPIFNHRDERWWSRPDEFRPERFMGNDPEDRRHKFLFMPFGAGPHTCIGLHVGSVMVKLLAALLLARCDLKRPEGTLRRVIFPFPRPYGPARLSLQPHQGMPLHRQEERTTCP